MEEAILNSLLRYSKQTTPSRETYPIPNYGWNYNLRKSNPPINLSTYYLLDHPSLVKSSAKKKIQRRKTSNFSYVLPSKAADSTQKRPSHNISTGPSRRITEPETEVKNVAKKQEGKGVKRFKSFDSIEVISSPSQSEDSKYEFISFQETDAQVLDEHRSEFAQLKVENNENSSKNQQ